MLFLFLSQVSFYEKFWCCVPHRSEPSLENQKHPHDNGHMNVTQSPMRSTLFVGCQVMFGAHQTKRGRHSVRKAAKLRAGLSVEASDTEVDLLLIRAPKTPASNCGIK